MRLSWCADCTLSSQPFQCYFFLSFFYKIHFCAVFWYFFHLNSFLCFLSSSVVFFEALRPLLRNCVRRCTLGSLSVSGCICAIQLACEFFYNLLTCTEQGVYRFRTTPITTTTTTQLTTHDRTTGKTHVQDDDDTLLMRCKKNVLQNPDVTLHLLSRTSATPKPTTSCTLVQKKQQPGFLMRHSY